METHAHHLHNAPGKNFWHYFFEFLMLFLAVTLGFFVENEREHLIEHKREKILIKEMLEDLRKDTAYLHLCVSYFVPNHIRMMDSAINLLKQKGNEKDRKKYFKRRNKFKDKMYLPPFIGMLGVDLSEKMVQKSRLKKCYGDIIVNDVLSFVRDYASNVPTKIDLENEGKK